MGFMTSNYFNSLPKMKQQSLLLEEGVLLATRITPGYRSALFQVESFYVEVTSAIGTDNSWIACFEDTDALEPYLEKIDLSQLIG